MKPPDGARGQNEFRQLVAKEERRVAETWDQLWSATDTRAKWSKPSPEVEALLSGRTFPQLSALDVGCGTGRHISTLLTRVRSVVALDASMTAISACREGCSLFGQAVQFLCASMFELPFRDRQFGLVLAFNVVYHASFVGAQIAIQELLRCCAPDGLVLVTLLSVRNRKYGLGSQIEPNTFIREGQSGDSGVIHHFFTADEISRVAGCGRILYIIESEPMVNGSPDAGGHHWFVLLRA